MRRDINNSWFVSKFTNSTVKSYCYKKSFFVKLFWWTCILAIFVATLSWMSYFCSFKSDYIKYINRYILSEPHYYKINKKIRWTNSEQKLYFRE